MSKSVGSARDLHRNLLLIAHNEMFGSQKGRTRSFFPLIVAVFFGRF
jgi:hypothetical protein